MVGSYDHRASSRSIIIENLQPMIRPYILTTLLLAAILTMSCSRSYRYPQQLIKADSMTTDAPDSAITMLERLSPEMDKAEEHVRMYYRLLKIKAEDRAYRPITGDTAITTILEYYENGGDKNMLPEAYYYAGRVFAEQGNMIQAINYFQRSLTSNPTNTPRTKSRTYSQMGYIFSYQCLYDNAMEMFRNALECNTERKDTTGIIFDLRDIADTYKEKGIADSSLIYYTQALDLAQKHHNTIMIADVCGQIAGFYNKNKNYAKAHSYIRTALDYDDPADRSGVFSIAAKIYKNMGETDSAVYYYKKLVDQGSIYAKQVAHQELAEYYAKQKDAQRAIFHFSSSKTLLDSIQEMNASEPIAKMNALYNYERVEKEKLRIKAENNRRESFLVILISTCLIIIISLSYIIVNNRQRKRILKYKIEKYRLMIAQQHESPDMQDTSSPDITESDIYRHIRRMLNSPDKNKRMTDEDWDMFKTAVNCSHPGFDEKLSDLCKMSLSDYRICLLLKAGIQLKDIANLACLSPSGVTSVRSKLYQRAFGEKKSAEEWDKIILSL